MYCSNSKNFSEQELLSNCSHLPTTKPPNVIALSCLPKTKLYATKAVSEDDGHKYFNEDLTL